MSISVRDLFTQCISEAVKSTKIITDPYQKSTALASIALALATTGILNNSDDSVSVDTAVTAKGKESIKESVPKAAKAAPDTVAKPKAVEASDPKLVKEWTEEMLELKAEQIKTLSAYKEQYGQDAMDQCVQMYTSNELKELSDETITPLNIDGFLSFIKTLSEQA